MLVIRRDNTTGIRESAGSCISNNNYSVNIRVREWKASMFRFNNNKSTFAGIKRVSALALITRMRSGRSLYTKLDAL
jgi:hypothetical protein